MAIVEFCTVRSLYFVHAAAGGERPMLVQSMYPRLHNINGVILPVGHRVRELVDDEGFAVKLEGSPLDKSHAYLAYCSSAKVVWAASRMEAPFFLYDFISGRESRIVDRVLYYGHRIDSLGPRREWTSFTTVTFARMTYYSYTMEEEPEAVGEGRGQREEELGPLRYRFFPSRGGCRRSSGYFLASFLTPFHGTYCAQVLGGGQVP